jgi:glycosyltransferase involved in cell wall biosynthesis
VTGALLTALIPVRHYDPAYLREAIGSLLAQTSPRWRALIIHTPPSDAARITDDLGAAAGEPRIELIPQRGRKLAGALNTGLRAAQTEFTAILLGDDFWSPDAVAVLERNIVARRDVDFFFSSRRVVDDRGAPISSIYEAVAALPPEAFIEGQVKHLLCWRRSFALAIGGLDESLNSVGPDDYDFPWSMKDAGARHVREIRRILRKHGVPETVIRRRVLAARRSYLQQCLYSSRLDAWIKRTLGRDPSRGWRESYR